MSGHSKWSTIKRKKGAVDAKRSAVFTKVSKLLTVAAREGGGDIDMNFKLKLAVDKAKAANMPMDNIQRAIDRGTGGDKNAAQIEKEVYDSYGPDGVACLVTVLTDNKNRALSDMKGVFAKKGGSMGGPGTVAWMFDTKGLVLGYKNSISDLDELTLEGIDHGLSEVEDGEELVEFFCAPQELKTMRDFLESKGVEIESAELVFKPKNPVKIDDEKKERLVEFLEAIEELDDVDRVDVNVSF